MFDFTAIQSQVIDALARQPLLSLYKERAERILFYLADELQKVLLNQM